MSTPPVATLVVGAHNGIGLDIVKHLLERESDGFIFATARDPDHPDVEELHMLSVYSVGRLVVLKLDLRDDTSVESVVRQLKERTPSLSRIIITEEIGYFAKGALFGIKTSEDVAAQPYVASRQPVATLPLLRKLSRAMGNCKFEVMKYT